MFRQPMLILSFMAIIAVLPVHNVFCARATEIRDLVNEGRVTIITGGIEKQQGYGEFYLSLGSDLASALDKINELRVLPVLGYGSGKNIEDMLYLQGIDLGVLHGDLLLYLQQDDRFPTAAKRLRYITKLFDEQFHVLARKDVSSVLDLTDQPVAMGGPNSGTHVSAMTMFQFLGVVPKPIYYDRTEALEKLKQGEIAAMVITTRKPSPFIAEIQAENKVQLLPLPAPRDLPEIYTSTEFTHDDYPNLLSRVDVVQSLQFPTVLATNNWSPADNQFANVSRFVDRFFDGIEKLQQAPYDPVWRSLDLESEVPGWQRFQVAEEWLVAQAEREQNQKQAAAINMAARPVATQFRALLSILEQAQEEQNMDVASKEELEALYNQFQQWQQRQSP